ncbi:MAG: hypothetical protein WCT52_00815 [Candidatus Micrarchaeia archaeon]
MANKLIPLGKFNSGVEALHAANRSGFTIANLQQFNKLLLGENRNTITIVSDQRCFSGHAYLQEKKNKAFGNFVETETIINGKKTPVIVAVRKDLVGMSDRVLFFRQGLLEGNELMPIRDSRGKPLEILEGGSEIFVNPSVPPKAVFARRRQGLEFFLDDKEALRLFTSDDAAFGLAARCRDFFGGRGVVAATSSGQSDTLSVFGYTLPVDSYSRLFAQKSSVAQG